MFDYDKELSAAVEDADRYDLTSALTTCWDNKICDPYSIMEYIQQKFPTLEATVDEFTVDEWIIYLAERYGITFVEETSYRMLKPKFTPR